MINTQQVAGFLQPFAAEQITVSTVAIKLTASKYAPDPTAAASGGLTANSAKARLATITADGAIRYTVDGTVPTITKGHKVLDGAGFDVMNESSIANLQMIRDTSDSGDATVFVTYWR